MQKVWENGPNMQGCNTKTQLSVPKLAQLRALVRFSTTSALTCLYSNRRAIALILEFPAVLVDDSPSLHQFNHVWRTSSSTSTKGSQASEEGRGKAKEARRAPQIQRDDRRCHQGAKGEIWKFQTGDPHLHQGQLQSRRWGEHSPEDGTEARSCL